jgi:hypothetical protein
VVEPFDLCATEHQARRLCQLLHCAAKVALAIGAVMPLRAICQASATAAGVARCSAATASSASRIAKPRAFRYPWTPAPRGLLPKSASLRYLPLRKPLACP